MASVITHLSNTSSFTQLSCKNLNDTFCKNIQTSKCEFLQWMVFEPQVKELLNSSNFYKFLSMQIFHRQTRCLQIVTLEL